MNKKTLLLIITILILIAIPITLFFLTNCSNEKTPEKGNENTMTNNNSAIIYFSATGTTKKIAERIAKYSNSDLIEIIPKENEIGTPIAISPINKTTKITAIILLRFQIF